MYIKVPADPDGKPTQDGMPDPTLTKGERVLNPGRACKDRRTRVVNSYETRRPLLKAVACGYANTLHSTVERGRKLKGQ